MLEQSWENNDIYPGKIVKATVIQKDKDEVYVDFGYMKEGAIAYSEWAAGDPEEVAKTINVGSEVEAKVIPGTSKDDFVRLSKIRAEQDAAWKNVPELAEGEKRPATVKVLRVIKNRQKNIVGLAVAVEGVEGFMPASHVELKRVEDFTPYIGQELEAEIIEVDTAKKRLVVSAAICCALNAKQKHRHGAKLRLPELQNVQQHAKLPKKKHTTALKKARLYRAKFCALLISACL